MLFFSYIFNIFMHFIDFITHFIDFNIHLKRQKLVRKPN